MQFVLMAADHLLPGQRDRAQGGVDRSEPGPAPTACRSLPALLSRSRQQPEQKTEERPCEQTENDAHHDAARCPQAMRRDR